MVLSVLQFHLYVLIRYSQYVLSIMARLCAPVRDETIRALMREIDVVKVFRGVMETLDLMRLDMANFTIQQIRPHIIAQVECTRIVWFSMLTKNSISFYANILYQCSLMVISTAELLIRSLFYYRTKQITVIKNIIIWRVWYWEVCQVNDTDVLYITV